MAAQRTQIGLAVGKFTIYFQIVKTQYSVNVKSNVDY